MSSAQAFYFVLQETMNHDKYSWRREYLKLTLGGKRDKLEKVVEYENKDIYRPTGLSFGLPFHVRRSTKLEYTQALLRYRKDAAERKRVAQLEKLRKEQMQEGMDIARGFLPPRKSAAPLLMVEPEPTAAGLFDDFTIVDTEYQHEVLLEVAAIRFKNWQPIEEYQSLVHYTGWVSPFTTQHTGITEADVRRAPAEKAVLQALAKLAGDSLLIAHNIGADRSKLKLASERQGLEVLPNKWFCTMALARARLPKGVPAGLTDLCDRFKFGNENAHRAMSDVKRTFRVLRHFYQEDPITSLDPKARKAAPTLFAA